MKKKLLIISVILISLFFFGETTFAQCTEAKDPEMAKYKGLTETRDAQGCSQCAMLALYFCSAKYCATEKEKSDVGRMIDACKANIRQMGQPYCCPEYLGRQPEWGSMVNSSNNSTSSNSTSSNYSNQSNDSFDQEALSIGNSIQQKLDAGIQSYYAGQAVANANQALKNNSTLNETYNSAADLEADFNSKYQAIRSNTQEIAQGQNQQLNANYNLLFDGADATDQAVGQLAVGVVSIFNTLDAERQEREAKEALRLEKERKLMQMEANRKANQLALRNNFMSKFTEGGLPLSFHKVSTNEIYFFAYTLDKSTLTQETPVTSVSNVFPLSKYSDGTWPYKSNIIKEIEKSAGNSNITIVGYYTDKQTAEQMRNSFINIATKCEMKVNSFTYKGKTTVAQTSSNTDFWGNPVTPVSNKSTSTSKDDYWGEPVKTSEPVNKTSSTKAKEEDFWGEPVKPTSTPAKPATVKPVAATPATTKTPTKAPAKKANEEEFWGEPIKKN